MDVSIFRRLDVEEEKFFCPEPEGVNDTYVEVVMTYRR